EGKYIIVQTRKVIVELENGDSTIDIRGRIIDDNNIPVSGITIQVKGTKRISISDANGYFILKEVSTSDVLLVSGAEIEPQEIIVGMRPFIQVPVSFRVGRLDEAIVIGYGTTTRRFSTGSVTRVNTKDISIQPVANPL